MKRMFLLFFLVAIVAFAHNYQVQLYQPAEVGGQVLKPGNYKIWLNEAEDQMTISQGKVKFEVPIKVVLEKDKFDTTQMRVVEDNGKTLIREIRLGGSNKRVTVQ